MSIVQNPITGRTSGKFATAVFSKNYQKNTMRSLPIEVKQPNTPPQQIQKKFFKDMQSFLLLYLSMIQIGFVNFTTNMSAFASCMQYNLKYAWKLAGTDKIIDYTKVLFSRGNLAGLYNLQVTMTDDTGEVTITWDAQTETDKIKNGDRISFLFYNTESGASEFFQDVVTRSDLNIGDITLSLVSLDAWICYAMVRSYAGSPTMNLSNSQFTVVTV